MVNVLLEPVGKADRILHDSVSGVEHRGIIGTRAWVDVNVGSDNNLDTFDCAFGCWSSAPGIQGRAIVPRCLSRE